MTVEFDMRSPEFQRDPYPLLAQLRREDPVHRFAVQDPMVGEEQIWVLTRYDDCSSVLRDSRFTAEKFPQALLDAMANDPDGPFANVARAVRGMMLVKDPPDHTRLRTLVNKAFTPRRVEGLRPRIQRVADELLDAAQPDGRMDLIRDYAAPLPIVVIAELLGVPAEDRDRLKRWSDALATFLDGTIREQGLDAASRACGELREYMTEVVVRRRAAPREDLISALIAAQEQDDRLSDDELFSTVTLLLAAGHETTTNLIGNGMNALLRHTDQLEALRAQPQMIRPAVEELLRFESPVQLTSRVGREDVVIRGRTIPAGQEINTSLGGANRDPDVFPDPNRLDLSRGDTRHLSFGLGAHFCLGAALARLEGQIAIGTLVSRLPGLKLETEAPIWRPGIVLRGLEKLPVSF